MDQAEFSRYKHQQSDGDSSSHKSKDAIARGIQGIKKLKDQIIEMSNWIKDHKIYISPQAEEQLKDFQKVVDDKRVDLEDLVRIKRSLTTEELEEAVTDYLKAMKNYLGCTERLIERTEQLEQFKDQTNRLGEAINFNLHHKKERIENLLKELHQKLPRPTLSDLPQEQWWKLYIDVSLHEEAQKLSDPGLFFDEDKSPGYQQSMIELYKKVLVPAQNKSQKDMNYDDYTKIHEIAISGSDNQLKEKMRINGGIGENHTYYTFGYISEPKIHERIAALQEMQDERINGLPLFQNWQSTRVDSGIQVLYDGIVKSPPQAITVGWVDHGCQPSEGEAGWITMVPAYRKEEGPRHVNAILESYYQGRERPNQTEYQRLREIARTVRALHVMHPKVDGNGRTNIFGLMNKWLIEEGFCPAILPNGPGVFGGKKTLDGLVEDMLGGMHSFIKEVEQNRKKIDEEVSDKLVK